MKRKRTRAAVEKLAAEFEQRMGWLETAWGVKAEYEVDLSTGSAWLKLTMPGSSTAMVIRCDVAGITLPGNDQ